MFLGVAVGNVWIAVVEFFGGEMWSDDGIKGLV